jgi:Ca-activated chloride channel family protein
MLSINVKLHKEFFTPHTPNQRIFLQLAAAPEWGAAQHRPSLNIVFVIDTSGSMRDRASCRNGTGLTKLELVMKSVEEVLDSAGLQDGDRLALVSFDDETRVNVPFVPASRRARLRAAVHSLNQYSGGTRMGAGMREALELLGQETGSKRVILLTDGETVDADLVAEMSRRLHDLHVPVTAIGVGEFNESLLTSVADQTQGRVLDVVAGAADSLSPSISVDQLPEAILGEVRQSQREVVTDMALNVQTVKGVVVNRITRVAPQQNEVDVAGKPYVLGNAAHGEETVFILECTLPERPPNRMRLAQLGLTYQVPGADYRGETSPVDVIVEYTTDEARLAALDQGVLQWVQQRNVEGIIKRAAAEASSDPAAAAKTLRLAQNLTRKLGNSNMTKVLDKALDELQTNKTISLGTAKTMRMGSKTQTLRATGADGLPSSEEIRKLTGA